MYKKVVVWLTAALILGAGSLVGQTYMYGLEEFHPTPFHHTVYIMMEQCTGIDGDYAALRWYTAKTIVAKDGIEYWGIRFLDWGWPSIIMDREKVYDAKIVSHEIMHDLYDGQGPMDTYQRCVLDWENLKPLTRSQEEDVDEKATFEIREDSRPPSHP